MFYPFNNLIPDRVMWKKIQMYGLCALGIAVLSVAVILSKKWKDRYERPYVTLIGSIEMADGIGRQTVELAKVFQDDFKVNIITRHYNRADVPTSIQKLLKKRNKELGKIVIFEESLWAPGEDIARGVKTVERSDQIRIAYSMLESTRIPQEWVMQLNLYYDAVAVPDPFLIEAYKESGVRIPIFELPLGLDLDSFLKRPLKKERNPVMLFGNLSTSLDRKNQVTLIRAFAKALGNVKDAALHINCRGGDKETRAQIVDEILAQGCDNIYFTEIKLRNDAYLKFFETLDCYVSLSKGEGFSIQPREAMALGIPVIASDNTGQKTICNSSLVKSVLSAIKEPAYYFGSDLMSGYRFNCSVDEASCAIRDVYDHYSDYLENAQKARDWASYYNYSQGELRKLYKSLVSPKKIVLGKENKICDEYIMTSSEELYEKYKKIAVFSK
jgi:glycosyltransferase involved in cell wall biosynthesis